MAQTPDLQPHLLELIRRASTVLPPDVVGAIERARAEEEPDSPARAVLGTVLENVHMAGEAGTPICQDTGTPIFRVHHPTGVSTAAIGTQIEGALAQATERSWLRPNAVDSITGKNSGDNVGIGFPTVELIEWPESRYRAELMLKGGGCENVSGQIALPDTSLNAGRDLDGVRKAVLKLVQQAQGKGCGPGILGVAIGGDRGSGYKWAKKQLFRRLDDSNPDQELAELEETILEQGNTLEIGPMGFGGRTTLLGVKVGALHRLPASYYVSVAYMCWACRRAGVTVEGDEATHD